MQLRLLVGAEVYHRMKTFKFRAVIIAQKPVCEIQTPFVADFVDDLKDAVPIGLSWSAELKVWQFPWRYMSTVQGIADRYYNTRVFMGTDEVTVSPNGLVEYVFPFPSSTSRQSPPPPPPREETTPSCFRTLHVSADAPEEVIKAAYRALAHSSHPDKGGSADAMRKLNLAYEEALRLVATPAR